MSTSSVSIHLRAGVAAALTLALSWPCAASPNYAEFLQSALKLEKEPACTLCHRNDDGGDDTVVTAFGKTVLKFGAAGDGDLGSLASALKDMGGTDSDGDGIADVTELRLGQDPNHFDSAPEKPDPPDSGAGGQDSGASEDSSTSSGIDDTPQDADGSVPIGTPTFRTGCSAGTDHPSNQLATWLALALLVALRRPRRSACTNYSHTARL